MHDFSEYAIKDYRRKLENTQIVKETFDKLGVKDVYELVSIHTPDLCGMMRQTIREYLSSARIDTSYIVPTQKGAYHERELGIKNYEEFIKGLPDKTGWRSFYCDIVLMKGSR